MQIKEKAKIDGTLLPDDDPRVARVRPVGSRIVESAADNYGGGSAAHVKVTSLSCHKLSFRVCRLGPAQPVNPKRQVQQSLSFKAVLDLSFNAVPKLSGDGKPCLAHDM
jgi:hypothetical protein